LPRSLPCWSIAERQINAYFRISLHKRNKCRRKCVSAELARRTDAKSARLLYAADIVVAADDARFALGYGALGLTADGGNTWFLPRVVGMRRAQELFLLNRRLTAQEALEFGLVSRLVSGDAVEGEATALAATLAAGPTLAFGAVRRMLRQSFETGLSDQLDAEKESIVVASRTDDAQEGIAAFVAKRRPRFRGG
jgi:2-(1,2-epoxy-1,2-dihydrophenyl)acetyl-CoA isomerase